MKSRKKFRLLIAVTLTLFCLTFSQAYGGSGEAADRFTCLSAGEWPAPVCPWLRAVGGNFDSRTQTAVTDAEGNIYVIGSFEREATFGPVTLTNRFDSYSVFLLKYDVEGNFLKARQFETVGGAPWPIRAVSLGNAIYFTFHLSGFVFLTDEPVITSNYDVFLVKVNTELDLVDSRVFAGNGAGRVFALAANEDRQEIALAGDFTRTFELGETTLTTSFVPQAYIAAFGTDFSLKWAKTITSSGESSVRCLRYNLASHSYLYGGHFFRDAAFDTGTQLRNPVDDYSLLVGQIFEDGQFDWARFSESEMPAGFTTVHDVVLANDATVYVTGALNGKRAFALPNSSVPVTLDPAFGNAFLIKYSFFGDLIWTRQAGDSNSAGTRLVAEPVTGIPFPFDLQNGRVYWLGHTGAVPAVGGLPVNMTPNGNIFLAKINKEGLTEAVFTAGAGADAEAGELIQTDEDHLLLAGSMSGDTLLFGRDSLANPFSGAAVYVYHLCLDSLQRSPVFELNYASPSDWSNKVRALDYDTDGDPDFFSYNSVQLSYPYRNDSSAFSRRDFPIFTKINYAEVGDDDRDGDLDILAVGDQVYLLRYQDGQFVREEISPSIPGYTDGLLHWIDIDHDGDLDIFAAGRRGNSHFATLYERKGASYETNSNTFALVGSPAATFLDKEHDGDLDLVLGGRKPEGGYIVYVYEQINGRFVAVDSTSLLGAVGAIESGDLNADGWEDLAIGGLRGNTRALWVYLNDGTGRFTLLSQTVDEGDFADLHLTDIDNDGKTDVVSADPVRAYTFNGSAFIPMDLGIADVNQGLDLADFDRDGRLDLVVHRPRDEWPGIQFETFSNRFPRVNQPPQPPANLRYTIDGQHIRFEWDPGSDDRTPAAALGYNVCIGTGPGRGEWLSVHSDTLGRRLEARAGNVKAGTSFTMNGLPNGEYVVSVQSIDAHYAGSAFASIPFTMAATLAAPELLLPADLAEGIPIRSAFRWNPVTDAQSYRLQIAEDPGFDQLVYDINGLAEPVDSVTVPDCQTVYYWRVQGLADGFLGTWSAVFTFTSCPIFTLIDTLSVEAGAQVDRLYGVDIDQDADLDIAALVYRTTASGGLTIRVVFFENVDGRFRYRARTDSLIVPRITSPEIPLLSWIDRDGDGDFDFYLTGRSFSPCTYYENNGGAFSPNPAFDLPEVKGELAWFDANNDNQVDLIIPEAGALGGVDVWIDDNGAWRPLGLRYTANEGRRIQPLDFNNDGLQDFYVNSGIIENQGDEVFSRITSDAFDFRYKGDTEIADIDRDGDDDLLITGISIGSTWGVRLYENDNGQFLPGIPISGAPAEAAFADYNLDGFPDLLLSGIGLYGASGFQRNRNGRFELSYPFAIRGEVANGSLALDIDNDGDPDLAYALGDGDLSMNLPENRIFIARNNEGANVYQPGFVPPTPVALEARVAGDQVTLVFDSGQPNARRVEAPAGGYSYNVAVGRSPDRMDVVSPLADLLSGRNALPQNGNAGSRKNFILRDLAPGTYYWTVQAIGSNGAPSFFAPMQSFTITTTSRGEVLPVDREAMRLAPNPAHEEVQVLFEAPVTNLTLRVFDAAGRQVLEQFIARTTQVALHLNALPAGLYVVKGMDGRRVYSARLVKVE